MNQEKNNTLVIAILGITILGGMWLKDQNVTGVAIGALAGYLTGSASVK